MITINARLEQNSMFIFGQLTNIGYLQGWGFDFVKKLYLGESKSSFEFCTTNSVKTDKIVSLLNCCIN